MKLFTLILLLTSVSMPALAKKVETSSMAKKCELNKGKEGRGASVFTAATTQKVGATTKAN